MFQTGTGGFFYEIIMRKMPKTGRTQRHVRMLRMRRVRLQGLHERAKRYVPRLQRNNVQTLLKKREEAF